MGICIPRRSQHLPARRKLVLVGDGGCGKTSLLNVFTRGYFPQVISAAAVFSLTHTLYSFACSTLGI